MFPALRRDTGPNHDEGWWHPDHWKLALCIRQTWKYWTTLWHPDVSHVAWTWATLVSTLTAATTHVTCVEIRIWCLGRTTWPCHKKPSCIIHQEPLKHSELKTILFRHLSNTTSLILIQFSPQSQTFTSFYLSGSWTRTGSGNRCSGCLISACGRPAGFRNMKQIVTQFLETHNDFPPSSFNEGAARWHKSTQLCWIKHLTHWLVGQRASPWGQRGQGLCLHTHYTS